MEAGEADVEEGCRSSLTVLVHLQDSSCPGPCDSCSIASHFLPALH